MNAILDWTHDTRAIPEAGLSVTREAAPEARAALAEAMELIECRRLVARYVISQLDHGRFHLKGDVKIDVTQLCGVTLQPLERSYTAPLDFELWPAEALADESETDIDSLGADPEPIEDGRINIGRIIYEELVSTVDPFPRSDDATFEWEDKSPAAAKNPFAALEKLKRKGD